MTKENNALGEQPNARLTCAPIGPVAVVLGFDLISPEICSRVRPNDFEICRSFCAFVCRIPLYYLYLPTPCCCEWRMKLTDVPFRVGSMNRIDSKEKKKEEEENVQLLFLLSLFEEICTRHATKNEKEIDACALFSFFGRCLSEKSVAFRVATNG